MLLKFSKLAAQVFDVLAGVRLNFFHAMHFGAQNIAKKRCWSVLSLRTEAASYKWLVQVSLIFSGFFFKLSGAL